MFITSANYNYYITILILAGSFFCILPLQAEDDVLSILSSNGSSLFINSQTTIIIDGHVDSRTSYNYSWYASAGTIDSNGISAVYTAPGYPERVFVTVIISSEFELVNVLTIPLQVYKQYVIFKADDVSADIKINDPQVPAFWAKYFDYMKNEAQCKTSAGIIGQRVENASNAFFNYIRNLHEGSYVEFWNHGYDHGQYAKNLSIPDTYYDNNGILHNDIFDLLKIDKSLYEFQGTDYEFQYTHMETTQNILKNRAGITLKSFGAPFNKIDLTTAYVIRDLDDMNVWLFGRSGSSKMVLARNAGEIEYYFNNGAMPSFQTLLNSHNTGREYAVLQLHPNSGHYRYHFNELHKIVNYLKQLESTFIHPNEFYELKTFGFLPMEPWYDFVDPALEAAIFASECMLYNNLNVGKSSSQELLYSPIMNQKIKRLDGIQKLSKLKEVHLQNNDISNFTAITNLKHLEFLNISNNPITNTNFLRNILSLDTLYMNNMPHYTKNMIPVTPIRNIQIQHNNISDFTGFSKVGPLDYFDVSNNMISSIDTLLDDVALNTNATIDLTENPLDVYAVCRDIPRLEQAGYTVIFNQECDPNPDIDYDDDGLTYAEEIYWGTDPFNPDTSGNGIPDGWLVSYGIDPLDYDVAFIDLDGDGYTVYEEYQAGTDPTDPNDNPYVHMIVVNHTLLFLAILSTLLIGYHRCKKSGHLYDQVN